jgi:hypothetical protein
MEALTIIIQISDATAIFAKPPKIATVNHHLIITK